MIYNQLQRLIMYAYNNVSYYKETFDRYKIKPQDINSFDELERLPVLTKEQIQSSPDSFLSKEYSYFPKNKELSIRRTSGSTGKYMKIYWDNKDDIRSMLNLWMIRNKDYGVEPKSKFCSLYTTMYNFNKLVENNTSHIFYGGRNLALSKIGINEHSIKNYYSEVFKFNPEWFFIQPSIAYLLAEYISNNNLEIPKSLKYIELTGEYLFESVRKKIESTFNVQVSNQYGCNETNGIAIECNHRNLHCLTGNVFVEILKDGYRVEDGEEGEIYLTCLTNYAMPFIRYAIGDRGALIKNHSCPCGKKTPVLKLSSGRVSEYISTEGGGKVNCYVFLYTIEQINESMGNPIIQFKIVQNAVNNFKVYLVINESFAGWKDNICKFFCDNIREESLKDSSWEFEFVESIYPDSITGKTRFFENKTILATEL